MSQAVSPSRSKPPAWMGLVLMLLGLFLVLLCFVAFLRQWSDTEPTSQEPTTPELASPSSPISKPEPVVDKAMATQPAEPSKTDASASANAAVSAASSESTGSSSTSASPGIKLSRLELPALELKPRPNTSIARINGHQAMLLAGLPVTKKAEQQASIAELQRVVALLAEVNGFELVFDTGRSQSPSPPVLLPTASAYDLTQATADHLLREQAAAQAQSRPDSGP